MGSISPTACNEAVACSIFPPHSNHWRRYPNARLSESTLWSSSPHHKTLNTPPTNQPTHSEVCFYLVPAGSGNSRIFPTPVGVTMLVASLPPPRCACMVPDYIDRCVNFSPGQGQLLAEKPVREIHNLLELQRAHGNLIFFIVSSND